NVRVAISALKSNDYQIIAIEQAEKSVYLNDFKPLRNERYALLLGNEVNGVSEEAMSEIQQGIEIPQFGTKHSLNGVVSAGNGMWACSSELLSQYATNASFDSSSGTPMK